MTISDDTLKHHAQKYAGFVGEVSRELLALRAQVRAKDAIVADFMSGGMGALDEVAATRTPDAGRAEPIVTSERLTAAAHRDGPDDSVVWAAKPSPREPARLTYGKDKNGGSRDIFLDGVCIADDVLSSDAVRIVEALASLLPPVCSWCGGSGLLAPHSNGQPITKDSPRCPGCMGSGTSPREPAEPDEAARVASEWLEKQYGVPVDDREPEDVPSLAALLRTRDAAAREAGRVEGLEEAASMFRGHWLCLDHGGEEQERILELLKLAARRPGGGAK